MEAEVPLPEVSIDIEKENAEVPLKKMVTSLREGLNKLSPLTPNHCIYRVPKQLHVKNPAAYTPQIVAIGPIHHKRKGLEAMEEYKKRYMQLFLERVKISLEDYADFVKDREGRLRECYADTINYMSNEFVKIMMIDSAFVYEVMVRNRYGADDSCRIFSRPYLDINVMGDLMLLENQIPLFILEDLFNLDKQAASSRQPASSIRSDDLDDPEDTRSARDISTSPPLDAGSNLFMELVCKFVNLRPDIGNIKFVFSNEVCSPKVVHLLDCLWRCHLWTLLVSPPSSRYISAADQLEFLPSEPESRNIFCQLPEKVEYLILGCLRRCRGPCSKLVPPQEDDEVFSFGISAPTATELHQSGVRFTQNTKSTHLLDIKFDCQKGILKIPHFFLGDSTESIFRNLLAFEQCHYIDNTKFNDYFCFLDQLISEPSDVDLLVQSKVLENKLGDNMRAAIIFNNMAQGLSVARVPYFWGLCTELTGYYKVPWHKWKATLRQGYFNNPWAGISVIAAVILLVLTVVQTLFAVIS